MSDGDLVNLVISHRPVALAIARALAPPPCGPFGECAMRHLQCMSGECWSLSAPPRAKKCNICSVNLREYKFLLVARLVCRTWKLMEQEWATCTAITLPFRKKLLEGVPTSQAPLLGEDAPSNELKFLSLLSSCLHVRIKLTQIIEHDYQNLARVQFLTLHAIPSTIYLEPIKNVPYITIRACFDVRGYWHLGNNKCLVLARMDDYISCKTFGTIERVIIHECYNFTHVKGLLSVKELYICGMLLGYGLPDFMEQANKLCGVKYLRLCAYIPFEDPSCRLNCKQLHTLNLTKCIGICTVPVEFGDLHTLILDHSSVQNVEHASTVFRLSLQYCKGVRNVSALGTVHSLNLRGSTSIVVGMDRLNSVRRLVYPNGRVRKKYNA